MNMLHTMTWICCTQWHEHVTLNDMNMLHTMTWICCSQWHEYVAPNDMNMLHLWHEYVAPNNMSMLQPMTWICCKQWHELLHPVSRGSWRLRNRVCWSVGYGGWWAGQEQAALGQINTRDIWDDLVDLDLSSLEPYVTGRVWPWTYVWLYNLMACPAQTTVLPD